MPERQRSILAAPSAPFHVRKRFLGLRWAVLTRSGFSAICESDRSVKTFPIDLSPGLHLSLFFLQKPFFKNCIAFKRRKVFQYPRREMKITRLLGIALIAIAVATGASSCCSVKRYLAFHGIGPEAIVQPEASSVQVTLILRNIATSGFIEWKVASDQMCTQSSGRIGPDDEAFEQTWQMGTAEQHIWFWWDTLNGDADATVLVNNVVVFEGHCAHVGYGQVQMINTCSYPRVYKTFGTGPYLIEPMGLNQTNVVFASSKLPP